MSDSIRELVRYQIPGYICIVYATFLLLPFLDFEKLLEPNYLQMLDVIIAGIVSGIAIGWILFQFYHVFSHERLGSEYAWKKPREILRSWDKDKKTCAQFRDRLMDYALHKSDLRAIASTYWSHASSTYIVGRLVPFASVVLAIVMYFFAQLAGFQWAFNTTDSGMRLVKSTIIWVIIFFVFFSLSLKTPAVLDEVQNYIVLSLVENEEAVKKLIESEYANRNWSPVIHD